MKNTTRKVAYIVGVALAAGVFVAESAALFRAYRENGLLESSLETATARVAQVEGERDGYRKQLIQNGNPEGWTLSGDSFTGEVYYARQNGDAIGNVWTEVLK